MRVRQTEKAEKFRRRNLAGLRGWNVLNGETSDTKTPPEKDGYLWNAILKGPTYYSWPRARDTSEAEGRLPFKPAGAADVHEFGFAGHFLRKFALPFLFWPLPFNQRESLLRISENNACHRKSFQHN